MRQHCSVKQQSDDIYIKKKNTGHNKANASAL